MERKVVYGFLISALLLVLFSSYVILKMYELSGYTDKMYTHPLSVTSATRSIQTRAYEIQADVLDIIQLHDQKKDKDVYHLMENIRKSEAKIESHYSTVFKRYLGKKSDIQKSYDSFLECKKSYVTLLNALQKHDHALSEHYLQQFEQQLGKFIDEVNTLIYFAKNKSEFFLEQAHDTSEQIIFLTVVITGLILFLILLMASFVSKSVSNHKRELIDHNKELQELTDRYNQAQQTAKLGVWELDIATDIGTISKTFNHIFELDPDRISISREEVFTKFHPDDIDWVQEQFSLFLNEGKPYNLTHRLLLSNGYVKYIHAVAEAQYDKHGKPYKVTGIVQDITEQKLQELVLKDLSNDLKEAQEIAKVGNWKYDIQNDIVSWSNETFHILGQDENHLVPSMQSFIDCIHPDDKERVTAAYEKHLNERARYKVVHRVVLPNGSIKYVEESCKTQYGADGNPMVSKGTIKDLTDEIEQQKELEGINKGYKKALEDLEKQKYALDEHAIVAITDIKGTITYVNEKFTDISGYGEDELLGNNHRMLNSGHHDNAFWQNMYAHITKGETWHAEVCNQNKSGELYWVDTTVVPFVNDQGVPESYIAIRTDITDRKQQESIIKEREIQLQHHSRLAQMGEMISMIAHQWRQPLAAISSVSLDLKMQLELETYDLTTVEGKNSLYDNFFNAIDDINAYVRSLTNTIDDFRNFYKPNKRSEMKSVNDSIQQSLHIVRSAYEARGITFKTEYASTLTLPLFNNELIQVWLNLFKNANDAFEENGIKNPTISIRTSDTTDGIEVLVKDNAGGIPDTVIENIFDPYFSTKNSKNGTGLGLYMSKIIVEEHHKGVIKVENINEGACFAILLPLDS